MKSLSKKTRRLWNAGRQQDDSRSEEEESSVAHSHQLTYSPVKIALSEEPNHVNEMEIGIEISLDWDAEEEEAEQTMHLPAVLNLADQMRKRNRVHRSQFSVSYPALHREEKSEPSVPLRRGHRVPLWETDKEQGYKDVLKLLRSHRVKDEVHAVKDEIERLTTEIKALGEDQRDLEEGRPLHSPKINLTKKVYSRQWDVDEWLALGDSITTEEREFLERRRGLCLTLYLHNKKARETFMSACGWTGRPASLNRLEEIVSLNPSNCSRGGAAETIRHVAIVGGRNNYTAFFLSRDRDRASTSGYLPQRLFQKMKGAGLDARHDLLYLSTGPLGCYYAEFRSGHCWWGNALKNDTDFQSIVQSWDIYRVVFGPIVTYDDDNGHKWTTNSWIILGRDGRAAWKNLPSRLHEKLQDRLADWPAPAEVTLGSDDSYFIRFLDGTIDYCLPAEVASVCAYIEKQGGRITDMSLHPDVSQDFVIRHTELRN